MAVNPLKYVCSNRTMENKEECQRTFECKKCNIIICRICAMNCHSGHDKIPMGIINSICSCEKCKRYSERTNPNEKMKDLLLEAIQGNTNLYKWVKEKIDIDLGESQVNSRNAPKGIGRTAILKGKGENSKQQIWGEQGCQHLAKTAIFPEKEHTKIIEGNKIKESKEVEQALELEREDYSCEEELEVEETKTLRLEEIGQVLALEENNESYIDEEEYSKLGDLIREQLDNIEENHPKKKEAMKKEAEDPQPSKNWYEIKEENQEEICERYELRIVDLKPLSSTGYMLNLDTARNKQQLIDKWSIGIHTVINNHPGWKALDL